MIKVLPLEGPNSLAALTVCYRLLYGVKLLPEYMLEDWDGFFERVHALPLDKKEKLLRHAVLMVDLGKDEIEAALRFCADPNGVPYRTENIKAMPLDQLFDMVVAVCLEVSKIKINMLTASEKKN